MNPAEEQFPHFDLGMFASAEPEAYTGEALDVDPLTGEVLAWRCWRLSNRYMGHGPHNRENGRCLWSCWLPVAWTSPSVRADLVPKMDNHNGLYCFRQVPVPHDPHAGYLGAYPAFGLVALSGRILVGSHGFRAERAMVRRVWLHPNAEELDGYRTWRTLMYPHQMLPLCRLVEELSQRYACDVSVSHNWPRHAEWEEAMKDAKGWRSRYE